MTDNQAYTYGQRAAAAAGHGDASAASFLARQVRQAARGAKEPAKLMEAFNLGYRHTWERRPDYF